MHGRPRKPASNPTAEDVNRVQLFESLLVAVLKNHKECNYTKEAFEESSRLVELNPDVYTAWNFRKLALKQFLDAEPDEDARKALINEELIVNENALKVNIKSYVAWHHRTWLIELGLSSLDHELQLLSQLFKVDARNFNAWDYRRYIVRLKGVLVEDELDYSMTLINKNFSNYSAWHNRSALLLELFQKKNDKEKEAILDEEFELVRQALYTDSADQSGWFYHSWLLGHSSNKDRLVTEIEMCRDLLQQEDDISEWARKTIGDESKFPRLTLARLLTSLGDEHKEEVLALYDSLIKTDPVHAEYYADMKNKDRVI